MKNLKNFHREELEFMIITYDLIEYMGGMDNFIEMSTEALRGRLIEWEIHNEACENVLSEGDVVQENATHMAIIERGKVAIYEKGLKLEGLEFPERKLYRDASLEMIFNFFESSDENNRILFNEYKVAYEEVKNGK